jgi:hypothetical protein
VNLNYLLRHVAKLNFKSKNLEEYNRPFSLDELRKSLDKAHDTACGPDDIHYQLLKHLPKLALQVLLDLMNDIWETGSNRTIGYRIIKCVLGFPVNDCVPMDTYMTSGPCENYMLTNSNKAFINLNNC